MSRKFVPVGERTYVHDAQGLAHRVIGWASDSDWMNIEPVVADPDGGPGIAPWPLYHGKDPWTLAG